MYATALLKSENKHKETNKWTFHYNESATGIYGTAMDEQVSMGELLCAGRYGKLFF